MTLRASFSSTSRTACGVPLMPVKCTFTPLAGAISVKNGAKKRLWLESRRTLGKSATDRSLEPH